MSSTTITLNRYHRLIVNSEPIKMYIFRITYDDFESFPEKELIVDEQVESDAPKTALILVFKNAH